MTIPISKCRRCVSQSLETEKPCRLKFLKMDGWLLEVVDEYGNSTVWDDPFDTEQEALDEAMNTIDEEGINALIGPESGEWK